MDIIMIIGRVLFALMFVSGGLNHFTKAKDMAGYAQFKKVPAAKASVFLSGVVLLLGGLSVILGIYADLGAQVKAGILSAPVDSVYPIDDIREALRHADKGGRHGKILVSPNGAI